MQQFVRPITILFASLWLSACVVESEELLGLDEPLDDTVTANATGDSTAQTTAPLDDDAIDAPPAPTLQIEAAPRALRFSWVDNVNTDSAAITEINLFQFDARTELETLLDVEIDTSSTSITSAIITHQLAWDSTSFRVEICTEEDCLSSLRVPIDGLLANATTPLTPSNTQLSGSFGDNVALNATGSLAVVTSPAQASAVIFFNIAGQWIEAVTLNSANFTQQADSVMKAQVSANGDTIAIASASSSISPRVVIFDRLGEGWIETASIVKTTINEPTLNWLPETLALQLSANGDRLAFAINNDIQLSTSLLDTNDSVFIYERGSVSWVNTAELKTPLEHARLPAFDASATLDRVIVLSALADALFANEFAVSSSGFSSAPPQLIEEITAVPDGIVVASADASEITIAGREITNNSQWSAVAWRFQNIAGSWVANDSVRLPPVSEPLAALRLAADSQLNSIVLGWQAVNTSNLAFFAQISQLWQPLFSVPDAFNLNRTLPFAESVAISADNSTALIGTVNTGNGGLATAF